MQTERICGRTGQSDINRSADRQTTDRQPCFFNENRRMRNKETRTNGSIKTDKDTPATVAKLTLEVSTAEYAVHMSLRGF